jgi:hypothetical protein
MEMIKEASVGINYLIESTSIKKHKKDFQSIIFNDYF